MRRTKRGVGAWVSLAWIGVALGCTESGAPARPDTAIADAVDGDATDAGPPDAGPRPPRDAAIPDAGPDIPTAGWGRLAGTGACEAYSASRPWAIYRAVWGACSGMSVPITPCEQLALPEPGRFRVLDPSPATADRSAVLPLLFPGVDGTESTLIAMPERGGALAAWLVWERAPDCAIESVAVGPDRTLLAIRATATTELVYQHMTAPTVDETHPLAEVLLARDEHGVLAVGDSRWALLAGTLSIGADRDVHVFPAAPAGTAVTATNGFAAIADDFVWAFSALSSGGLASASFDAAPSELWRVETGDAVTLEARDGTLAWATSRLAGSASASSLRVAPYPPAAAGLEPRTVLTSLDWLTLVALGDGIAAVTFAGSGEPGHVTLVDLDTGRTRAFPLRNVLILAVAHDDVVFLAPEGDRILRTDPRAIPYD